MCPCYIKYCAWQLLVPFFVSSRLHAEYMKGGKADNTCNENSYFPLLFVSSYGSKFEQMAINSAQIKV